MNAFVNFYVLFFILSAILFLKISLRILQTDRQIVQQNISIGIDL